MPDEKPERSPEFRAANSKMWSLNEDVMDKVYDIVRDLPPAEQKELIEDWFGDDFHDAYLEWLDEGD